MKVAEINPGTDYGYLGPGAITPDRVRVVRKVAGNSRKVVVVSVFADGSLGAECAVPTSSIRTAWEASR